MNLDDYTKFTDIDKEDMYSHIISLPEQLLKAWQLGMSLPLNLNTDIKKVIIGGMGGSAIGGDLISSYLFSLSPAPYFVQRGYELPEWAHGPKTLVITSSHSGNTEETLSLFKEGLHNGCTLFAICTGGELEQQAMENNVELWKFDHSGQPRTAVGFSFGLLLALANRLGFIKDQNDTVEKSVVLMKDMQKTISKEIPIKDNLAKELALRIHGKWIAILGSGVLATVARRWKGQVSEVAKTWAQFEEIPEADHNTLAGILNPKELIDNMAILFLSAQTDHEKNKKRAILTAEIMAKEGIDTIPVEIPGEKALENIWSAITLGDFVAYYLAMLYKVDPTVIPPIQKLKQKMSE